MGAVVSAISWMVGKLFADNVLRYVAMKAIMAALFIVILPLVLNNLLYELIELCFGLASTQMGNASAFNGTITVTGIAGWLVGIMHVPESVSVVTSALLLRVTLNMVPFIKF